MEEPESSPKHRSFQLTQDTGTAEIPSVGSLREAMVFAIVQQVILFLLSSMLLDGGGTHRRTIVAIIAFWCFVILFLIRRANRPTKSDLLFIKYGIWLLFPIIGVVAGIMGRH